MVWIKFLSGACVIVLGGIRLTRYADKLSEKSAIGKAWVGILLLGFVTSLPEAVTSIVSIVSLKASDLAVGNLLGSNAFNPMLLIMMDFGYRKRITHPAGHLSNAYLYSAYFAIIFTLIVVLEILFSHYLRFLQLGAFGLGSIFITAIYFGAMKYLSVIDSGRGDEQPIASQAGAPDSMAGIWINIALSALAVVAGAVWVANTADMIAVQTGLGRTFVGSVFLAIVTSLPEMVVSLSALRLGAVDLALGNVFGSNMTNMFIVAVCDGFYRKGSIYLDVSLTHIFMAVLSVLLTVTALFKLKSDSKKTIFGFSYYSAVMTIIFVLGTYLLYTFR